MIFPAVALAADRYVEVPFVPPAEIALFLKAQLREERGTAKGDDCPGAVALALAQAAEHGRVVRVTLSTEDLKEAALVPCKQRMAGDAVSASVVDLTVLVMEPGSPPSVYPVVPVERAVQIAALIGAVTGGGLASVTVDDIGGHAWVRMGEVGFEDPVDPTRLDEDGRAAKAYAAFVPQWVGRWAGVFAALPEVRGAILEVLVPCEDPAQGRKSRTVEVYRFSIPTAATAGYSRGEATDEQLLAASLVERAPDAKKRVFARIVVEAVEGE